VSVRPSVRPAVPSIDRSSGVWRVCRWAQRGLEISIDSGGRLVLSPQHGAAAANADSATFTAAVAG